MAHNPILIVCMGVSGSGKSTLGRALADEQNWRFIEADDFHSAANKAWMASGKPLSNAMRAPWIQALIAELTSLYAAQQDCVLAYSGLVQAHRDKFRALDFDVHFVHLETTPDVLQRRLKERQHHFMPASLLESQFATLDISPDEPDVLTLNAGLPPTDLLSTVRSALGLA